MSLTISQSEYSILDRDYSKTNNKIINDIDPKLAQKIRIQNEELLAIGIISKNYNLTLDQYYQRTLLA